MPSFQEHDGFSTPFGINSFLRSTRDVKTESRTFARETLPAVEIDGHPDQQVLNKGVLLCRITSGPDTGKVGPYVDGGAGTSEVQTLTEGTNITAGTFVISAFNGDVVTDDIAFDANAATVQAALRAALAESDNDAAAEYADSVTVTGGPVGTTPLTITWVGADGANVPQVTVDTTDLTGTITVATGTPGVGGATDGRGDLANAVGFCNTFLPWQLMHRDVEVAVVYEASVVQERCLMLNAAGAWVPVSDTVANAIHNTRKTKFTFHTASTEID